eukprot:3007530-Amphidinium_carterae.1
MGVRYLEKAEVYVLLQQLLNLVAHCAALAHQSGTHCHDVTSIIHGMTLCSELATFNVHQTMMSGWCRNSATA